MNKPTPSPRLNLIDGPILPALATLSWPVILSNLLQTAYNLVDMYWVGRLGADAVAAISLSFPIVFLFISIGAGFTIAGTALVAQYIGAGRTHQANFIASQTFAFIGLVSLFLSILGYYFSEPVVRLLGPEPAVIADAAGYLRVWFLGIPFIFGFFVFQALLRGAGNTVQPMKIMVVSSILNIVLDPFLIFGWWFFPAMGVQGAAVATVIARGLATVVGLWILFDGSMGLRIALRWMKPHRDTLRRITVLGIPAAMEQSMKSVGMLAMTAIVTAFGTPVLAAFGIGNRIISVVFQPSMGMAEATAAMVGQNLGAGREARAERTAWLSAGIVFLVLSLFGVLIYFITAPVAGVFLTPADGEALAHAVRYLRIAGISFGFIGAMNVFNGALRGAGRTREAMLFSLLALFVARVPLVYGLSHLTALGSEGLWWGVAGSSVLGCLFVLAYVRTGKWKQRLVEDAKKE